MKRSKTRSPRPAADSFPGRVLAGLREIPETRMEDIAVRQLARLGEYAEKVAPFNDDWFEEIGLQPRTIRLSIASTKIPRSDFETRQVRFEGDPTDRGTRKLVVSPVVKGPFVWQLARPTDVAQTKLQAFVEKSIKKAIHSNAQVLVINEMGFPGCSSKGQPKSADELYRQFFLDLLRKPLGWNTNPLCVVPGTMHCFDEYTNSAPIYHYKGSMLRNAGAPKGDSFAVKVYQKKTSATGVDEYLRVPSKRALACIKLGQLTITPLICLDLYDATQLFSIVRRNLLFDFHQSVAARKKIARRVDIILVPSYGMQPKGLPYVCDMLERLSLLAGCVVVLAHSNDTENEQRAFYFGATVKLAQSKSMPGVIFRREKDGQHAFLSIGYKRLLDKVAESKEPGGIRRAVDAFFNHGAAQTDAPRRL